MSNTFVRRAPSGHVLTVEWDQKKLSSEVAGVRFAGSKYGRAFQIGTRGFHDDACRHILKSTTAKALKVGRHEVRLATSAEGDASIATLIGDYHELMTVFSGPAPSENTIAGLFSVLEIADMTEGLVVRPSNATLLTQMNENVMLVNDTLDSVDCVGPAHAKANKPKGRGAKKGRGGEVWRRPLPGRGKGRPRDFAYTIGFRSALGEVMPGPVQEDQKDADLAPWLDSIELAWQKD
ncbi:hypothetical protein ACTQ49_11125 [Luteococcus sp. Sow4_B9]|uniref:hypothetical protein n=1 Tax=Luteococcus sp. Sow4_B9 TaxID=3438792 RepID=UPI003F979224